ncbi:hypothetical protein [Nocardioides sp. LS1]|uniref:hypothetical protein n=1 Tax=Nocardioides sp. LS1 TaxID=1027620 RepID=UPI000FFADD5C|nr:hypothetical protein [Nocardioides sp. LS1]GCD90102.1 hypothetical protein NLS1_21080 [Nocardioides sp. LS1]
MIKPRHLLVPAATAALVLTAAGAFAGQESAKDAAGDAPSTADITRVTVTNGDKTFTVRVKLHKASAERTHVVATLAPATEGAPTYVVRTVETGQGKKVGATLETTAAGATEATAVDCAGIKAAVSSGRNGQVHVRVPQSCFGDDAGDFTVDVVTVTGAGDVSDETDDPIEVEQG